MSKIRPQRDDDGLDSKVSETDLVIDELIHHQLLKEVHVLAANCANGCLLSNKHRALRLIPLDA